MKIRYGITKRVANPLRFQVKDAQFDSMSVHYEIEEEYSEAQTAEEIADAKEDIIRAVRDQIKKETADLEKYMAAKTKAEIDASR